jgi:hypothetical protein
MDAIKSLKLNPTVVLAIVAAALSATTAFGLEVDKDQAAAITGMVTALLAVGQALSVKPFYWPVVSGLFQAAGILAAAYGFNQGAEKVAAVAAVLQLVLGIAVRPGVTPETKLEPLALPGR